MSIPDEQFQLNTYEHLWARYRDIYAVATGLVQLGKIIKYIGVFVSGASAFTALVLASKDSWGFGFERSVLLGLALFGILAGAAIFGLGVLIAACGQLLRALVDTSVNTSPLLTTDERATIIFRAG